MIDEEYARALERIELLEHLLREATPMNWVMLGEDVDGACEWAAKVARALRKDPSVYVPDF